MDSRIIFYGIYKICAAIIEETKPMTKLKQLIAPKWIQNTPRLKDILNKEQWFALEEIRKEFQINHEQFLLFVLSSPNLGAKIIKRDYGYLRKLFPHEHEKAILSRLIRNDLLPDPALFHNEKIIEEMVENLMTRINTLDELCHYMAQQECEKQPDYFNSTLGQRIETIIGQ